MNPTLNQVTASFEGGTRGLASAIRRFDEAGIELADLSLRRPTLDDVFMSLTGRRSIDGSDESEDEQEREVA